MIPVLPTLIFRALQPADSPALVDLINRALRKASYSEELSVEAIQTQIFGKDPPGVHSVRWQDHQRLGAWRARQLVGFLDAAVGLDDESADLPSFQPLGLIRFLALPERADLVDAVARGLLAAAMKYWRAAGVGRVKAFHLSTGYPTFQAGAGILPGDWADHVRVLTSDGYRLVDRYYCLRRILFQPVEEVTPLAGLSLVMRGRQQDRRYELFRRTDLIGHARVVAVESASLRMQSEAVRLVDLHVEQPWRGQDIGKWLLRRIINDLTVQECHQIIVYLDHSRYEAMNLFNQHGFEELSYRGYTLEKTLTE